MANYTIAQVLSKQTKWTETIGPIFFDDTAQLQKLSQFD